MRKDSIKKYVIISVIVTFIFTISGVYAVEQLLSSDILFDNKDTKLEATNVQDAIDELYTKFAEGTCYTTSKTRYTESILNGTDPILGDKMIPVTIDGDGTVHYANVNSGWYKYSEKQWANAVELIATPSKEYKECDIIKESDIRSYFVWIPRYKYKIWNEGNYDGYYTLDSLTDNPDELTSIKNISNNSRTIEIVFENKNTTASTGSTIGSYLTHPAFTSFNVNGFWVGKFELTGNLDNITVKPDISSLRGKSVLEYWYAMYKYNRKNDSHMMKNTEWGSVVYLSHSQYGINAQININNNKYFITGYSASPNTNQSTFPGENGNGGVYNTRYNTTNGVFASTTGNISGVYDMSGGAHELVAGHLDGYGLDYSTLELDPKFAEGKYFDKYNSGGHNSFSNRILGDATGEIGPFYFYQDNSNNTAFIHNSWYSDYSSFINTNQPWFIRGCDYMGGVLTGQFDFDSTDEKGLSSISSRIVQIY